MNAISIIVPTLNESANIPLLVERISKSFRGSGVSYEIIFVDDHSSDMTQSIIKSYMAEYPISLSLKKGPRGKAYSLLQGFKLAKHDIICMIDADLQYPPEAILPMHELMVGNGVDVVLSERYDAETSKLRQLSSSVYNLVFTRLLFGFDYDTQSGLKLFKKEVAAKANLNPTPWSFDLEFIVRALENNFKILSYRIVFAKRNGGEAKVRVLKVTYELATASMKLRLNSSPAKIKRAYKMNLKLAESALSVAVLTVAGVLAATVISLAAAPGHASALSIPDPLNSLAMDTTQTLPDTDDLIGQLPNVLPIDITPGHGSGETAGPIADDGNGGAAAPGSGSSQPANGGSGTQAGSGNAANTAAQTTGRVTTVASNGAATPASTVSGADTTYPRLAAAPDFTYTAKSAPVSSTLTKAWLASLITMLIASAFYILVTSSRNKTAVQDVRAGE